MKVYIGPYTPWWVNHIHRDYMDKKYDYRWDKSNTFFEKSLEKVEDGINWFYHHTFNRYFAKKKRKIKVKIDDYDIWGMDNTLAHIILPMLKQLKATKHGSPYVDEKDLPVELRLTKREKKVFEEGHWNKKLKATEEEIEAASKKFHSQFDWIMDQMIWSFEQEIDEDNEFKYYYDPYLPDEPVDVTDTIFSWETEEWRRKIGKYNREKRDAYEKRKQFGFTMFGKYFQSLWS